MKKKAKLYKQKQTRIKGFQIQIPQTIFNFIIGVCLPF